MYNQKEKYVVKDLLAKGLERDLGEPPSDAQPSCRRSVQTTSRERRSAADWDSTAG